MDEWAAVIEMTHTTQTQCKDGNALNWGRTALYAALGMLLVALAATSYFNRGNE